MTPTPDAHVEDGGAVFFTGMLQTRPPREPDYHAERVALMTFITGLADTPDGVLNRLVIIALDLCDAHSAGLSFLRREATGDAVFYWPAIAGSWSRYVGGTTPRHFSPCGVVLDRDSPQLVCRPERHYGYFRDADPPVVEAVLAPFHVDGKAVGTVWIVSHDTSRRFDVEDARRLESLARCASAAFRVTTSLHRIATTEAALTDVRGDVARLNRLLQAPADLEPGAPLSDREGSVVRLLARGHTNAAIAGSLGVSVKTVETYRARATRKLQLRGRAGLVRYAMTRGWLQDP